MGESAEHISNSKVWEGQGRMYSARLAKMTDPRQKLGLYWGYQTRIAGSLEELTSNCPFKV
jgi:predicted SPOUT superfamily RNA methylase MTH1